MNEGLNTQETKGSEEKERLGNALKEFVYKFYENPDFKNQFKMPTDIDVSNPHMDDIKKITEGNFNISNIRVDNLDDGKRQFSFYVGSTQFYIAEKAAKEIENMLNN